MGYRLSSALTVLGLSSGKNTLRLTQVRATRACLLISFVREINVPVRVGLRCGRRCKFDTVVTMPISDGKSFLVAHHRRYDTFGMRLGFTSTESSQGIG